MFLGLVDCQLNLLIIHLIADNALDLPVYRVNVHVLHQRRFLTELSVADFAPESFDSTVYTLVNTQTVGIPEVLITDGTREHQFLVDGLVTMQGAGMSERRRAFLALEGLVLFVLKRVTLQIRSILEQLAAQRTD